MTERAKFWSDDFDMDLLKVFPQTPGILGDVADRMLWTVGHSTFGRLNHPSVWNTHGAYLWLSRPNLRRDEHGWFNVYGCVGDEPEIECTWLEWLRDAWAHSYSWVLIPSPPLGFRNFPAAPINDFMAIMYDLRKWIVKPKPNVAQSRARSLCWLTRVHAGLKEAIEEQRNWERSFEGTR